MTILCIICLLELTLLCAPWRITRNIKHVVSPGSQHIKNRKIVCICFIKQCLEISLFGSEIRFFQCGHNFIHAMMLHNFGTTVILAVKCHDSSINIMIVYRQNEQCLIPDRYKDSFSRHRV